MQFFKKCFSNFEVINSFLKLTHYFFDYFIKRKKGSENEKRLSVNCL